MSKVGKALCVLVCIVVIIAAINHIITKEDKQTIINEPEIHEYEMISVRPYIEVREYGVICKKEEKTEYVEYIYKTDEGIKVRKLLKTMIEIGDKNQVVAETAGVFTDSTYYVTLDTYNKMYDNKEN